MATYVQDIGAFLEQIVDVQFSNGKNCLSIQVSRPAH